MRSLAAAVGEALRRRHGAEVAVHFVPGRLEILGKHTDYAGGRSLTCAVDRGICLGAARREGRVLVMVDLARGLEAGLGLDDRDQLDRCRGVDDWRRYAAVIVRRLGADYPGTLLGTEISLASDLPSAAGMSSSSALVVALFLGLAATSEGLAEACRAARPGPLELAGYLGAVESGAAVEDGSVPATPGVGTFGGSQDHTAILGSRSGQLRSYSYDPVVGEEAVALPSGLTFAVAVSGVRAPKAGAARSSYNRLAGLAAAAGEVWRLDSGAPHRHLGAAVRSVGAAAVRSAIARRRHERHPTEALLARFDQFVEESEVLVPKALTALRSGDLARFGSLVDRSQQLAEEKLSNQLPETTFLARSARDLGAVAASAFGAGFGGSVWALIAADDADGFIERWRAEYTAAFPQRADSRFLCTRPAGSARRILI